MCRKANRKSQKLSRLYSQVENLPSVASPPNGIICYLSVINVTLPDEKQNYIHRIGRVGRAERFVFYLNCVTTPLFI